MKDYHKLRCFINTSAGTKLIYQKDDGLFYAKDKSDQGVGIDQTELIELGNIDFELCTGLKDKDGKLIYEGDIITWTSEILLGMDFKGKVLFMESSFWIEDSTPNAIQIYQEGGYFEIIGNIYEKPELLENK